MVSAGLVASVAVILPAMGLLWLYLNRYDGYFEHNRLFFALVLGLFAGTAVRFLEVFLFPFDHPRVIQPGVDPFTSGTLVYSFAYTTFGLALMETLGKTAVLGFKKFRSRKDTPYYGAALGVGFGAMWTIQVAVSLMNLHTVDVESGKLLTDQASLIYDGVLLLMCVGLLFSHAASAIWVGKGAAEGKLWRGLMHGTLWLAPCLAFYWLFTNVHPTLPAVALLGWGIFAMAFANRRILERIVPAEMRDMVRKERRRTARRQGRE